jgi:hypothetical protein
MSISANFPTIRPSLLLDFANTRTLDPRITFARASTATFYDNKTTAMAEQNLLTYSEQFDNAIWTKLNGTTVTANSTTAPDGNATADTVVEAATTNIFGLRQAAVLAASSAVFSVYAKPNGRDWIQLVNATGTGFAFFNVTTGVVGTTSSATATITAATNGFYRCSVVFTASTGANTLDIRLASADGTTTYAGNGTSGVYLWGAQLEQRSTVTAYTPTTTAAITNYIPVLQTAASGVARFDCNPTTSESLGLLIEESRTNLALNSGTLTSWVTNNNTTPNIVGSQDTAPDGTISSVCIPYGATGNTQTNVTIPADTLTYTFSFYAKSITSLGQVGTGTLGINGGSNFAGVIFNFSTLAVGTGWTATNVGNGWYRLTRSFVNTSQTIFVYRLDAAGANLTTNGVVMFWGAQLEAGSFATSYIPTVASQVTRAADSASMTGTNFSSWYNQSQGSFYSNTLVSHTTVNRGVWSINDGTGTNRVDIRTSNSNVTINGTNYAAPSGTAYGATKLAYSLSPSNYAISVNGGIVSSTVLIPSVPVVTLIYIGGLDGNLNQLGGTIKRIAYYPKALTSTELQGLTS